MFIDDSGLSYLPSSATPGGPGTGTVNDAAPFTVSSSFKRLTVSLAGSIPSSYVQTMDNTMIFSPAQMQANYALSPGTNNLDGMMTYPFAQCDVCPTTMISGWNGLPSRDTSGVTTPFPAISDLGPTTYLNEINAFTYPTTMNTINCGLSPLFVHNFTMEDYSGLVWSWDLGFPYNDTYLNCAIMSGISKGRWKIAKCDQEYWIACLSTTNPASVKHIRKSKSISRW